MLYSFTAQKYLDGILPDERAKGHSPLSPAEAVHSSMSTTDSDPGGHTSAVRHAAGTTLRCRGSPSSGFSTPTPGNRIAVSVSDMKSAAPFAKATAGAGSADSTSEAISGGLTPQHILFHRRWRHSSVLHADPGR
jgi:hypothetical protein